MMTKRVLKFIKDTLDGISINYSFMEWNDAIVYPYFIGEKNELEPDDESGEQDNTFIITGTTRGSYDDLETKKEAIISALNVTTILDNDSGLVITYTGSFIIPTGDMELKRIQMNFNIKEWSVNNT